MDSDVAPEPEQPEPEKAKASLGALGSRPFAVLKHLSSPFKIVAAALTNLPIPKKLVIPAIAGAVLLTIAGGAFGLLHARLKNADPHAKTVASTPVSSAPAGSATGPSPACSGVVRDLYRQAVAEDPTVTLAQVRSEVASSGVNCAPLAELADDLKDLSAACRDMVQYTYLGVRDGHPDIKVSDIREKVVEKSIACEHDRAPNIAEVARKKPK